MVATSGGGIRAGVWTAEVLTELEEHVPSFPNHLRLVTGASGGMYGASYYVQSLKKPGGKDRHDVPLDEIPSRIAEDSLKPTIRELVLSDIPNYLIGATSTIGERDRGTAIEKAWQQHTDVGPNSRGFAASFSSPADGEREGWRPSLIVSPMMVEDGRRLLLSNLDLQRLTQATGAVIGKKNDIYSVSAIEFSKLFPNVDLQLSTVVRMNASFPYVTPSGTLPTVPVRRVVDAGYYDNFGINVAAAWLFHSRNWLANHTSGVLLIQIRDSFTAKKRTDSALPGPSRAGRLSRGLQWLTTPLSAIGSARNSTNSFRNDEELQSLVKILQAARLRVWKKTKGDQPLDVQELRDIEGFFLTTAMELDKDVSLSWTLTDREIDLISDSVERKSIQDQIGTIKEWIDDK